jgi:NADPH-dependent curcumin reductase CurA
MKPRAVVLARRPRGKPVAGDFRLEERPVPAPGPGEVLLRTIWLSLDPYMRGRLSAAPSYIEPVGLGEPIHGEAVAEVLESRHPDLRPGELVAGRVGDARACRMGWRTHLTLPGGWLRKLDPGAAPPTTALGVLGMPGLTAWAALREIARPRPGETLVVGAASGPVGSLTGQLARRAGCRVVGIAGGPEKCAWVRDALGLDAALDHRAPDLAGRLAAACPKGIDAYVELTGGPLLDAALPLLNDHARVAVIGTIAEGGDTPRLALLRRILVRRLLVQGLIVYDHSDLAGTFLAELTPLVRDGAIRWREDVVDGLERAPDAFIGLLDGRSFGKLLVRVAPEAAP